MIAEVAAGHKTAEIFRQIARQMTGRSEPKKFALTTAPMLEKLPAALDPVAEKWRCFWSKN